MIPELSPRLCIHLWPMLMNGWRIRHKSVRLINKVWAWMLFGISLLVLNTRYLNWYVFFIRIQTPERFFNFKNCLNFDDVFKSIWNDSRFYWNLFLYGIPEKVRKWQFSLFQSLKTRFILFRVNKFFTSGYLIYM